MRFTVRYKCSKCGWKWSNIFEQSYQFIARFEQIGRTFNVPAEVSPCCGHATVNMRTGAQIFLSDEEFVALKNSLE